MELVWDGVRPLHPGPAPKPVGKLTPLLNRLKSCASVGQGVSQLAAEVDPRPAGRTADFARTTMSCSRTVSESPITPSTPGARVLGSRTAVEFAKNRVPRESLYVLSVVRNAADTRWLVPAARTRNGDDERWMVSPLRDR